MISSLPPAVFGLKLWNTTISTTATTTQSIRFLTRSFIQLRSAATPPTLLDLCQLALRQRIHFRRTLALCSRLSDHHLGLAPPQFPHVSIASHALEQLDQQRAARPQVVVGEIHRQLRQVHGTRQVDGIHTTLI